MRIGVGLLFSLLLFTQVLAGVSTPRQAEAANAAASADASQSTGARGNIPAEASPKARAKGVNVASRVARTDLRVLVDVSGSMRKTDPHNLRTTASALLVDLLPEDADAAIWTFAGNPLSLMPHGPVDEIWRRQARYAIPNIHSRGQFTNMQRVLEDATADWRASDSEPGEAAPSRALLLLTDGVVDVAGGATESARARNAILSEVVPALQSANVAVHTVALSEAADMVLLKKLAETTGGRFELAEDAEDLSRIFLRMFEQSVARETVALRDGRFNIDAAIDEFTLVAFTPSTDSPITLNSPDGTALTSGNPPANVRWRRDAGYVVVTVREPQAGEWRLDGAEDPDNRVMIVTELALVLASLPSVMLHDESIRVRFYLTEKGVPISRRDLLEMLEAEVRVGDGASIAATLDAAGRFEALIPAESQALEAGNEYPLVARISAKTFERVVSKRIRIVENPLSLSLTLIGQDDDAAQAGVALLVNEDLVRPDTVRMVLSEHRPNASRVRVLGPGETPRLELWQDPGAHSLAIAATAVTRTGRVVQASIDPLTFTVKKGDVTGAPLQKTAGTGTESASRTDLSDIVWGLAALVGVLGTLTGWLALRGRGPSRTNSEEQAANADMATAGRRTAAEALRLAITTAAPNRRAALASLIAQIGLASAKDAANPDGPADSILTREQALLQTFVAIYEGDRAEEMPTPIDALPEIVGLHTDACLELAANLRGKLATAHPANDDLKDQLDALEANNARLRAHLKDSERSLEQMTAEYNAAFAHAAATATEPGALGNAAPDGQPAASKTTESLQEAAQAEADAQAETQSDFEAKTETRTAAEAQAQAGADADARGQAEAQADAEPSIQALNRSETEPDAETKSKVRPLEGAALSREDIDRLMRDPEDP